MQLRVKIKKIKNSKQEVMNRERLLFYGVWWFFNHLINIFQLINIFLTIQLITNEVHRF